MVSFLMLTIASLVVLLPSTASFHLPSTSLKMSASQNQESTYTGSKLSRSSFIENTAKVTLIGGLLGAVPFQPAYAKPVGDAPNLNNIMVTKEGKSYKVSEVLGEKATLLVNVASYCALTGGNYPGLVTLYEKYHDKGLNIIAMSCNDFGGQDPDPIDKIRKDMKARYNVQFPIFDKISVNGANAHPLYKALKEYEPELSGYPPKISWNFEKFLIGKDGVPLRRYRPGVDPEEVEPDIVALLADKNLPPARKRSLNDY